MMFSIRLVSPLTTLHVRRSTRRTRLDGHATFHDCWMGALCLVPCAWQVPGVAWCDDAVGGLVRHRGRQQGSHRVSTTCHPAVPCADQPPRVTGAVRASCDSTGSRWEADTCRSVGGRAAPCRVRDPVLLLPPATTAEWVAGPPLVLRRATTTISWAASDSGFTPTSLASPAAYLSPATVATAIMPSVIVLDTQGLRHATCARHTQRRTASRSAACDPGVGGCAGLTLCGSAWSVPGVARRPLPGQRRGLFAPGGPPQDCQAPGPHLRLRPVPAAESQKGARL